MKRAILITGVMLIAAAYVAGFWPERRRANDLQAEAGLREQRLIVAEGRVRLGDILGDLLALEDAVEARNYGDAAARASRYFDRVAEEVQRGDRTDAGKTLEGVSKGRDEVTAALARSEPAVLDVLRQQEHALRSALGYPVASQ